MAGGNFAVLSLFTERKVARQNLPDQPFEFPHWSGLCTFETSLLDTDLTPTNQYEYSRAVRPSRLFKSTHAKPTNPARRRIHPPENQAIHKTLLWDLLYVPLNPYRNIYSRK